MSSVVLTNPAAKRGGPKAASKGVCRNAGRELIGAREREC